MIEKTFIMIKPDIVERNLIGAVLDFFEKKFHSTDHTFRILRMQLKIFDRSSAEEFYAEHKGKDFFKDHIDYITSTSVIGIEIIGNGVIKRARATAGDTHKPSNGTIRHKYRQSITRNCVHTSDSHESANREAYIFFDKME